MFSDNKNIKNIVSKLNCTIYGRNTSDPNNITFDLLFEYNDGSLPYIPFQTIKILVIDDIGTQHETIMPIYDYHTNDTIHGSLRIKTSYYKNNRFIITKMINNFKELICNFTIDKDNTFKLTIS